MHIVGIVGSLRKDSFNRKLFAIASRHAQELGATVAEAPIGDIPLYNEDIEVEPWPASAKAFYDAVASADAVLIISPEYNYSIPGVLKNALDWASVGENAWKNKVVAIMGVSIGQYGTIRMQNHLRQALTGTGPIWVIPQPQVAIGPAAAAFTADGALVDPKLDERVRTLIANLIAIANKLQ